MPLDSRCKALVQIGDSLFSKRGNLMSLRQEIAEHYYYQRSDFTSEFTLGSDVASGSMSTYAYLARQELGNLLSVLLRSGNWFAIHAKDEEFDKNQTVRKWLEWASAVQRRAMYDRDANLPMSHREADHDIVAFGDAVLSVDLDMDRSALLYRNWHTRDCAWTEDYRRRPDQMHRKWKPTARILKKRFKDKVHHSVEKALKDEPETEFDCRHIVCAREDFDYLGDGKSPAAKWMSISVDMTNDHEMEATPIGWFPYVVPRFGTISGSQYGYSPCVVLPDARSANTIRMILLEAGEKQVDPPMILSREVFRSDMNIGAGGASFADLEADQKLSDVMQFLQTDGRGLVFGTQLELDIKNTIENSFFLNKIVLPDTSQAKTAYEIRKIVEQQVRSSAPLFEPLEQEYSAQDCEATFEALKYGNAFGPWNKWPEELQSVDTEFIFQNPLKETAEETKAQRYQEGLQLFEATAVIDPEQVAQLNLNNAFPAALRAIGWPADWANDAEAVEAAKATMRERAALQTGLQGVGAAGAVAEQAGKAGQALQDAGMV